MVRMGLRVLAVLIDPMDFPDAMDLMGMMDSVDLPTAMNLMDPVVLVAQTTVDTLMIDLTDLTQHTSVLSPQPAR